MKINYTVITAQAVIQQCTCSAKRTKPIVDPLMGQLAIRLNWQTTPVKSLVIRGNLFNHLDSRLRGNDEVAA